ncbi:homeobox-leucine zipper family protein [Striga asiatica]|uniref:Homeobox-leucine zipper family protein n=1 Tax=Striga asiatica TaxID=4170 RepID=A0A5A7QWM9_STRAF|nr:homeobox-leucine zipper family protein [Striga asiatica]
MGEQDDGLGLSLSLRCPENQNHDRPAAASFPLNLFRSPLPFISGQHRTADLRQGSAVPFYRGIDVNRPITAAECDEEVMATSSPNSTVSSLSGKRSEREENDGERASSSLEIDDEGGDGAAGRKKLRLSKDQAAVLEDTFKEHNTLNPVSLVFPLFFSLSPARKQKMALAKQLNLRPRQVEVWFQNRRARTKLKQTEVDCEYLRRCCDNLTEENRRLQKEVTELRALKLSPQFYMNMSPPTTLTMCPQCERVAVSSATTAGSSATAGRQPVAAHHHRPPPVSSWAAVIPPQALDAHRPRT